MAALHLAASLASAWLAWQAGASAQVPSPFEDLPPAALEAEDECGAAAGAASKCALSALQRRGQQQVAKGVAQASVTEAGAVGASWREEASALATVARASGSCQEYGCTGYVRGHSCQCNAECSQHGNCCSDYQANCVAASDQSCQKYGCVGYTSAHACQCNAECSSHGNCCSDYAAHCGQAAAQGGSCREYGCVGYSPGHSCQCNAACQEHGDCCQDFSQSCAGAPGGAGPPSASGLPLGHPSPGKRYPQHQGFTLYLVEEFDQPLDLDSDPIWTWSDGGLQIEGQVRFIKEAITFQNGVMRISVDRYKGQHVQSCSMAEKGTVGPKGFTGGEFRTRHNLFRYGRYEARVRAPTVQPGDTLVNGNYIASFFVYRDSKFDHWREIDFEVLGNHQGAFSTNIISADDTSEWRADIEDADIHYEGPKGLNLRQDFHTLAFEWLPNRIRWFMDGKLVREYSGGALPISQVSAKIMMNLWIFHPDPHAFGGLKLENNRYPLHSEYDWFRFYKWDGDAQYPCASLDDSCLTADDRRLSSNNPCDGIPQVGLVNGQAPCQAAC